MTTLLWDDSPIIRRIDENDVYKILMMYMMWSYYPNLQVAFGFTNRTVSVPLAKYVDIGELNEQLRAVAELRFTDEVIDIYRSWQMFPPDFLKWLPTIRLEVPSVRRNGDQLEITARGPWADVTLWEIPVLCIVSELYGRGYARAHNISERELWDEGNQRLDRKIELFNANPDLRIAQFGMRRRFSKLWETHATDRLLSECGNIFTGVSNMFLANRFGVEAVGTNAHEAPMALTALAQHVSPAAMREASYRVLKLWQRLYSHKSLIILDDTYGSDVFRRRLPTYYLEAFKGFRHDSGDPFKYGEDTIALYEQHGIDPTGRLIIFSDGLNPQKAIDLLNHFRGRILVAFGMGTNLTNDLGLIEALSLVMKVIEAAGNSAVKLSNNLNKATGEDAQVAYYKEVFGYTNTAREAVVY